MRCLYCLEFGAFRCPSHGSIPSHEQAARDWHKDRWEEYYTPFGPVDRRTKGLEAKVNEMILFGSKVDDAAEERLP
jgi:hypothetical protein